MRVFISASGTIRETEQQKSEFQALDAGRKATFAATGPIPSLLNHSSLPTGRLCANIVQTSHQ